MIGVVLKSAEGTSAQASSYPLEVVVGTLQRPCHFCWVSTETKQGEGRGSPESVRVEDHSSL